jgi:putative ABC transport system substrate-binding protein
MNGNDTDLVIAFTTTGLQTALRKIDQKPLLFGLVLDPFAAGAGRSDTDHRAHVTGVYLDFPYAEVARTIRQVMPAARRVGTLFTPSELNSVVARQRFEDALKQQRLSLESKPVNAPSEVSDAALALCQSKIDVFCQQSDALSNATFPAISRACDSTKTPLFAFASAQTKVGAILAVGSDYHDNGRAVGLLAAEVIRGKDPTTIPFQASKNVRRTVNLDNARRYSVAIPEEWLKHADVVLPAVPNGR